MNLSGNTILITGGTSGIGRALAEVFHQRGNMVIITGRRQHLLDEITAAHPGMQGVQLDVQDLDAVVTFADDIRGRFPHLNVLINNVGISRSENLIADVIDLSVPRSIIRTNIVSVIELTSALLPILMAQSSSTIITTTSGLAFVPFAAFPTYCASKAFLHSWLQSLRFQLRRTSIKVLELAPPYVQTELAGPHQAGDPHAMPLADYIAEVMELLRDPAQSYDEILVERVKLFRGAEKSGRYEQIFSANNNR